MPLTSGTRLGPYEIQGALGAGGMGEVYKARDSRLDRTVAVKVLPGDVASDAHLRARFEREARAIAALSHPHICVVHDVGRQPATESAPEIDFIVMEYLDGETLADRLTRTGPLPIAQVLTIGAAIADALDKAHRAGIVHRDLKPANVMLTKSGPKLLDFGLAKAKARNERIDDTHGGGTAFDSQQSGTTKALTAAHTILGTIHYMAPEQVEGREADGRTDIWALGALLYEMSTGQRPFTGDSAASVIGAILRDQAPLVSSRQGLAPAALDNVVDRCLQKDPDERWQNAGDVRRQLQWIATGRSSTDNHIASAPATRRAPVWGIAAACLFLGVALGIAAMFFRPRATAPVTPRTVLSIVPPSGVRMNATFALSPDGRFFTFVGVSGEGSPTLWLRALDDALARSIPGTEDASYPFWSPQSDAIGFYAQGKLKTIAIAGGVPRTLATVLNGRGGSWGADGTILFTGQNRPILRVSERGGEVTAVTNLDPKSGVTGHRWPTFVGPRHFTYTVQGGAADTGLYLASLDSTAATKLNSVYSNTLSIDGRLLFVADDMLVAQTLDLSGLKLLGTAQEILGPVTYTLGLGYAPLSMASNGTFAYTPRSAGGAPSELVWLDRGGKRVSALGMDAGLGRDMTYNGRLSPDGKTAVVSVFRGATADLWLIDLARIVASRFTFSDANDQMPIFSPRGDDLLFASNRNGPFNLFRKRVNDTAEETSLLPSPTSQYPSDWSRDGSTILFTNVDPKTQADIWMMAPDGRATPAVVLATPFNEYSARLSPDGRWLAYTSDESGRLEVYVQRFPVAAGKSQISTQGGTEPVWRDDGRELFYVAANQTLNAVPVQFTPEFSAGRPVKLSDAVIDTGTGGFYAAHYAPTADGQRFLANVSVTTTTPPMIVLNWMAGATPSEKR